MPKYSAVLFSNSALSMESGLIALIEEDLGAVKATEPKFRLMKEHLEITGTFLTQSVF